MKRMMGGVAICVMVTAARAQVTQVNKLPVIQAASYAQAIPVNGGNCDSGNSELGIDSHGLPMLCGPNGKWAYIVIRNMTDSNRIVAELVQLNTTNAAILQKLTEIAALERATGNK